MRYRKVMNRRTLLRGAGTIAIGLPFLGAMRSRSVWGAPGDPPVRAFNVFFGLGIPAPLQTEGLAGPLQPLEQVADKLLIVRNVDHVRGDIGGSNAHYDGATTSFNAIPSDGEVQAGGPTIDQVLRRQLYPKGQPEGVIPTLLAGTWFRRSRPGRYLHCWNEDGSPADLPYERPEDLFGRIFGEAPPDILDPVEARRLRYRRSILDSVVEQYQHLQSDASNLGTSSRARIADHLDNIREHEQRVFGDGPDCTIPPEPAPSTLPHEAVADPDGQGIDITVDELVGEWRLMCDLYALGVQCDLVRFGGMTFQAAGERIRLSGSYDYDNGVFTHEFDDMANLGVGGDLGCSHEYWHQFSETGANEQLRAHVHLMMREMAYFLKLLDDPAYADENGQTILHNALVSISTESGDGRHNDAVRELSGIFHAFSPANGRLRAGAIVDAGAEGIDVYNTIVQQGFGLAYKMGPAERTVVPVDVLLP
jgi:hypothetical protein